MKIAFQNFLWVKSHLNLSTKKLCQKTVKGQFHVKESGAKTSTFQQRKLLIGKSLIKHPLNAQRAVNLSLSTSNCYIACYQLFLKKKSNLERMISALFVIRKWKTWWTYFGDGKKTKNVWYSLFKWMQSCQLPLGELNYLLVKAALGLRPDRSKHKLHINFCCVIAKHYIWLCGFKEYPPILNNFLLYLKHIYQLENNAFTVKNKWEPLLPYISLLTRVSKT